jgi:hypothetical protein
LLLGKQIPEKEPGGSPEKLRELAYFALVRSLVEYSATVWDPHHKGNIKKLEAVQRRAARFVKGQYGRFDSVTRMLDELGWPPLLERRKDARLILFYKIINNLAAVPYQDILTKPVRCTRKNHSKPFRVIGANTNQYKSSFFPGTISAWNGLSKNCAEAPNINLFKSISNLKNKT